jgi:hypothetical protein
MIEITVPRRREIFSTSSTLERKVLAEELLPSLQWPWSFSDENEMIEYCSGGSIIRLQRKFHVINPHKWNEAASTSCSDPLGPTVLHCPAYSGSSYTPPLGIKVQSVFKALASVLSLQRPRSMNDQPGLGAKTPRSETESYQKEVALKLFAKSDLT